MDNTIAPIAARPATCVWWIDVTIDSTGNDPIRKDSSQKRTCHVPSRIDPIRIELHLCSDERLLGAVGSAGAFVAARAGLEPAGRAAVGAAAEEACRATFRLLNDDNAKLDVTVEQFPDRVEVTLAFRESKQQAAGPEKSGWEKGVLDESAGPIKLLSKMDRVQHTSEGGVSKTTLIKNVHSDAA
jgi:hypothetical protein